MPNHVDDPFRCVDAILREHGRHSPVVIVDMHAEATSEKNAMGWYLDGRASAWNPHTYQTADERILPNGTAILQMSECVVRSIRSSAWKKGVINGF